MSSKPNIKRSSGSPFKPPRYTEPTNVRETRKMRQSKFRRKYQEVRAINKSLYAQPGIETDDFNWNNYKYSCKPKHIPQSMTTVENPIRFPQSFVSLHGFQPGKELDKLQQRPKSADSVNTITSLSSLNKHNQFDDKIVNNSKRDRPKTALDNKNIGNRGSSAPTTSNFDNDNDKTKKRPLQWSPYFKRTPMPYELSSVDKSLPVTYAYAPNETSMDSKFTTLKHPHVNEGTPSNPNPIFGNFYKGIPIDMTHYNPKLVSNDLAEMAKKKPIVLPAFDAEKIGEQDTHEIEKNKLERIHQQERQNKRDDEIERERVIEMLKRSFGPKREPELPVEITRDFPRLSMDRINRNAVNTNKMFRGKDVKRGDKVGKNYVKKIYEQELKRFNSTEKARKKELKLIREDVKEDPLNINVKIAINSGSNSTLVEDTKSYARRRKSSISLLTNSIVSEDTQRRRRSSVIRIDTNTNTNANTNTNTQDKSERVRPGSAPYRLIAKKTNEDKFYIIGQFQAKERKRRGTIKITDHYYSHVALGDGQLVSSVNPVHFVTGEHGKLMEIQLKSQEVLKERPKSADATLKNYQQRKKVEKKVAEPVLGPEYGFSQGFSENFKKSTKSDSNTTVTMSSIDEVDNSDTITNTNTNTNTTTKLLVDVEAADKRRSKTVQVFRRKSRVIIEQRQELSEKLMKLCLEKDVTFTRALETGQRKEWREENIAAIEKGAMMMMFEKLCGEKWVRKNNWCSEEPLKTWHGLTIHNGALSEIHLPRNRLVGVFPYTISECKYLEVLNIDFNQLKGDFPNHILRCCQFLEVISARGNKFSGEIPFQVFAMMPNLREIWLSDNLFTGPIDKTVGQIKKLTHLCLYKNMLEGPIPNEIQYCSKLELLSLGRNRLNGSIPDSLRALGELTHLSLYLNKFHGPIPEWLDDNPNIKELNLFHNNFEGYVPTDAKDLYRRREERLNRIREAGNSNNVRKQLFNDDDNDNDKDNDKNNDEIEEII